MGARFSALLQTGPGAHPASCTMGRGLSRCKERPGRDADPSPLLVPWSRKSTSIPVHSPLGRTACTEPQCLYKGALLLSQMFYFASNLPLPEGRAGTSWGIFNVCKRSIHQNTLSLSLKSFPFPSFSFFSIFFLLPELNTFIFMS